MNNLIDKHNLAQEKVKLVFVVHPCGKKFMSLMLDLIIIATKEIMRRRKIPQGKSFDIDEVTQACSNMKEVENDLVNSIKNETKVIKDKTEEIRVLIIESIYSPKEFPLSFSEFIVSWHEYNQNQLIGIKRRSEKMKKIYRQTAELYARAEQILSQKNFDIIAPPLEVIKDIEQFYENAGVTNDDIPVAIKDESLNFPWLIAQLHLVLPAITAYVTNCSFESAENSIEELKVLKRLSLELVKIETKFDEFALRFRKVIPAIIAKLKEGKEERQQVELENESPEKLAARAAKVQIEMESLKLLTSPRYYFDASKECLKNVVVKKNRLALIDDDEGKENLGNETKFYRPTKSPYINKTLKMNQTVIQEMGPPKLQPRRRLDPMALLERATSSRGAKNRQDLNSTRYTGAIPKTLSHLSINKFSSTMLSPDLNHPLFNCSTVSDICKSSPILPCSPTPETLVESMFGDTVKNLSKPSSSNDISIPWDDSCKMKTIQMSPKGGLKPLVSVEEIFKHPPKLELNDETVFASPDITELTLCQEKSANSDSTSFSCKSIMLPTDEDLFNISDTLLKELDDED
jgi:HAUS augmin-like complex subunit 6 N-terminus